MEPEKPFACSLPQCGMTFTNEDHLQFHTKKHDMVLQLGIEQKTAFVADQTPTPTRFIRNCEEVGLFQDLQTVNPFDEGFKRAMDAKHSLLPLEGTLTEDLHTPHLVFPSDSGDCTLYTANNHRNITISRSSSDESGAVKEYETTTISKLTNEVTISRIVKDVPDRHDDERSRSKDRVNETVSYTNNVIKIHSNVERRKDGHSNNADNKKVPPIMSQQSLDLVVDSLTCDNLDLDNRNARKNDDAAISIEIKSDDSKDKAKTDDYEVTIKLPNGKRVKMKAIEDTEKKDAKEILKNIIKTKSEQATQMPVVQNVMPITGTLIPVTLIRPTVPVQNLTKIPIAPLPASEANPKGTRKRVIRMNSSRDGGDCKSDRQNLDRRSAASKRYREKLKELMRLQSEDNKRLREANEQLTAEKAILKLIITKHMKKCPIGDDLRDIQEKLLHTNQCADDGT